MRLLLLGVTSPPEAFFDRKVEALQRAGEGFVIPVRDPAAAADAVAKLARDPELRVRMGRAGRATVESKFRLDDQIARFIALDECVAAARVIA